MISQSTPYSIAVTGHRDLRPEDLPALRREIATVFDKLRSRMPATPLVLLSALAEGADQLVAEVALQHSVRLVAILPMPLDIYLETMSPEARQRLQRLYSLAATQLTLPSPGRTPDELRSSNEARADCYETLAHFLVGNAEALIALWDGQPSDKLGGTCRVINFARFGHSPGSTQTVPSTCTIVYHIMTPRLSSSGPAGTVSTTLLACEAASTKGS